MGGSWSNKASKGLLEESLELAGLLGNSGRDPRESGSQEKECALKENPYGTLGGKVLSPSKVFCPSGGLEDIINFKTNQGTWRSVGGGQNSGNEVQERNSHLAINRHLLIKGSPKSGSGA